MTGTFRFKTKQELISSGWIYRGPDLIQSTGAVIIPPPMLEAFEGRYVKVINNKAFTNNDYWYVYSSMVLSEESIVTKILSKYSNGDR